VRDVVLAGVGVLRGDLDALVGALHLLTGRVAVELAAVGVTAPDRVDVGEGGVGAPSAGVAELEEARAPRTGARAAEPRRGPALVAVLGVVSLGVRPYVVLPGRRVEQGGQPYGVVEQPDRVRERVTEEARDAQRHIDPGTAQLLVRDGLQAG